MRIMFRSGDAGITQPALGFAPARRQPALIGAIPRPVPFAPLGKRLPLVFIHIPRTSGSSFVNHLREIYGPDGVQAEAEAQLPELLARRTGRTVQTDCVAGYLPLMRWEFYEGSAAYRRVTMLRDPWARLVSYINWIDRFNNGAAIPAGHDAGAIHTLADAVSRTDFASRSSIERMMRLWTPVEGNFDNLQVRMLLPGTMAAMVKPLTPRDVDHAVRALDSFALVGFCEEQAVMQRRLAALMGTKVSTKQFFDNGGKPTVLSVRNELAREVLEPWYAADQMLYAQAKAIWRRHAD